MKSTAIAVSVAVLVFGVAILAQTQTESVEQELIKLENAWADAVVKKDLAFLEGIWADDYAWTASDGNVWSKAQTLASLKSGEDAVLSLRTDDVKVRVYGDAAVATGRSTFNETFKGKDVSGSERFTDTWVRRSGRWQCVAMHCSRIAQK
jgi:ketosteroid isomerase-like protein